MVTKTIEELKAIENEDSDRICDYCPLPIPNWEKRMGAWSHRKCWAKEMKAKISMVINWS